MKFLSKIGIIISLLLFFQSAYAITTFTTITQALQYCPTNSQLLFISNNPRLPDSQGNVTGKNASVSFTMITSAIHPQSLTSENIIANAQFRNVDGYYGYISGNQITCLYTYPGFTGVSVGLILQGMQ